MVSVPVSDVDVGEVLVEGLHPVDKLGILLGRGERVDEDCVVTPVDES